MAIRAHSTPAAALLRVVPMSLWPEHVLARRRRLQAGLKRLEALRDELIEKLDVLEGDPDFEPSLARREHPALMWGRSTAYSLTPDQRAHDDALFEGAGATDDREADGGHMDVNLCSDNEPSLGSSGAVRQLRWASGNAEDLESEHDGREPQCEDEGAQCDDEGVDTDREPGSEGDPVRVGARAHATVRIGDRFAGLTPAGALYWLARD